MWVRFSGAVRWADCLGIVTTPVAPYAARPVSLLLVGCTVLGAPWSRNRRGRLAANVERDRLHPRHPRCARLASITQRMKSRGRRPRTFGTAWENRTHHPTRSSVSLATAIGCTVLGAPRSRDRRGRLDATVGPARFCPCFPRCINRALTDQRFIFRGHSPRTISYGLTDVIRHHAPGGRGSPPLWWVGSVSGNVVATQQRCPQRLSHGAERMRITDVLPHPAPGRCGKRTGIRAEFRSFFLKRPRAFYFRISAPRRRCRSPR